MQVFAAEVFGPINTLPLTASVNWPGGATLARVLLELFASNSGNVVILCVSIWFYFNLHLFFNCYKILLNFIIKFNIY